MYITKDTAAVPVATAAGLAETGVNSTFFILTAVLLIILGLTLVRLFQSKPSMVMTGPKRFRKRATTEES